MLPFPWPWPYDYSPGAAWEIEPQGIYNNATLIFCKNLQSFPATYWTLQYGLVPWSGRLSGPILFSATSLNGGNVQLVNVPPSVTKQWMAGKYTWQCFAQITQAGSTALGLDISTRTFVASGTIIVFQDLTNSGAVDTRGKWQKIVDEIEAMILVVAGDTQEEIAIGRGTIAGQTLKGWDRDKLIAFHDYALHMAGNEARIKAVRGGAPNPRFKWAVMTGSGNGVAWNGYPDFAPFA